MEKTADKASVYDALIDDEIDFRVETRGLHTTDTDGILHMPDHEATIRINPDGSEQPLWVVGSRYEVVDHREIIKGFAQALDKADLSAEVEHKVYVNGCRIYSIFTLERTYSLGKGKPPVRPFFTLTTSHDGSLRLGFMVGARVGKLRLNVSKTVYGSFAKHTKGINIEKTLSEITKALDAFVSEVIPMWERMHDISLTAVSAKSIIDDAVKKNVLSKRRAENISVGDCKNVWGVYTEMIKEVNEVRGKRGTEERAFDRNTQVGEYFGRIAKGDMTALETLIS